MRTLCRPLVGVLLPVAVTFQFGDFLGQVLPHSNHIWVVRSHELDIVQIVETVLDRLKQLGYEKRAHWRIVEG
jgi:hypothetical protein